MSLRKIAQSELVDRLPPAPYALVDIDRAREAAKKLRSEMRAIAGDMQAGERYEIISDQMPQALRYLRDEMHHLGWVIRSAPHVPGAERIVVWMSHHLSARTNGN